jgi:polyisoprenoid-binding protein YceI
MNNRHLVFLNSLLLFTLAVVSPLAAAEYQIDVSHSTIGFQVRHMAISKTNGVFDDFTGSFSFEPGKPETWSCEAVIQAASINTNNDKRDEHLTSEDFFNAAEYPTLSFKSTGVKMEDESEGVLMGNLTIHGVTKPVELDFEVLGTVTDPWDNERAGFSANVKINRQDFGLSYTNVLEAGGLVVGDEVKIFLEIEGIKNKE